MPNLSTVALPQHEQIVVLPHAQAQLLQVQKQIDKKPNVYDFLMASLSDYKETQIQKYGDEFDSSAWDEEGYYIPWNDQLPKTLYDFAMGLDDDLVDALIEADNNPNIPPADFSFHDTK